MRISFCVPALMRGTFNSAATLMALAGFGATAAFAAGDMLNLAATHTVVTFDRFNLASNITAVNGNLITVDSLRDVMIVRGINSNLSIDVPVSAQPQYVLPLGGNQVAVSDPANDYLHIIDWQRGRSLRSYHYTQSFGPSQMAYNGRTIFGANRFDQLLTRFDNTTGRETAAWQAKSGPTDLSIVDQTLYLVEEGVANSPIDDYIAWYKISTGQRMGQQKLYGAIRKMAVMNDQICVVLGFVDELRCGYPERDEWSVVATHLLPSSLIIADNVIWVLSRGENGNGNGYEAPMLTSYVQDGNGLRESNAYSLASVTNFGNIRHLAYDSTTRSLLVRGDEGVIAVPLQ